MCVFDPLSNGLTPAASPSWFVHTFRSSPCSRAYRSRNSIIARNFQVVSTCSSGNGRRPGWNAFCASRSMTAESLPMLYSITGRSNSAATSRMMWMLSASSAFRCVRW